MVSVFLFPFFSYINQVMIKLIFIIKYTVFVHIKLFLACRHTVYGWSIQDEGHSGSDCICHSY